MIDTRKINHTKNNKRHDRWNDVHRTNALAKYDSLIIYKLLLLRCFHSILFLFAMRFAS